MRMEQEKTLGLLCRRIEAVVGRTIQSPKDFDWLSELIHEKQHERISVTTLKRIWGYVQSPSMPRISTLDLLCQFIDIPSWDAFCHSVQSEPTPNIPADDDKRELDEEEEPMQERVVPSSTQRKTPKLGKGVYIAIAAVVVIGLALLLQRSPRLHQVVDDSPYILHCGDRFASTADYLRLFGIEDSEHPWGVALPKYEFILVWGPEYQHPVWHNTGNVDSMMPTITEWEYKEGWDSTEQAMRNEMRFQVTQRVRELRITFMKNLIDSDYVFLGVYRVDQKQSDKSHIVWERILDACDLSRLDYLESLRIPEGRAR